MRDGIVTGEGVVVDARPAAFLTRGLALLIDLLALTAVLLGAAWALSGLSLPTDYQSPLTIAAIVTLAVIIPTTIETLSRGLSIGKLALGIRVVRLDGGPITVRHAFVRALVAVGETYLTMGSLALVVSLLNSKGRRLGDLLAGTYVVRDRSRSTVDVTLAMPPHLASWARTADMRRLPDGLALAARQMLSRAERLAPDARTRLGGALASEVEQFVAPGPPPGTHPELFLMAVLTERREREWVTAQRTRDLALEQAAMLHRLPYGVPDPA
ncbi:RDD family protein [Sanguibacter sp. A247]|uniref:RDD family protein n=1 Tax=unclassified Sanguibacter TaxID=2645534 RepID=UPI003FD71611